MGFFLALLWLIIVGVYFFMTYFEYLLGNTPDGAKRAFGVIFTSDNDEKVLKIFSDYEKAKSYCDFAFENAAEKDGVYTVELNDFFETEDGIEKARFTTIIEYGRGANKS